MTQPRQGPPGSTPADLPASDRYRWALVLLADVALLVVWVAAVLAGILDAESASAAAGALRTAAAVGVAGALVGAGVYATWRLPLERLALRPGPILVLPVIDRTEERTGRDSTERDDKAQRTVRSERTTAALQRALLRTHVYGPTAIPTPGRSTDFLSVVESSGAAAPGLYGALSRLVRLLAPSSTYEVRVTLVSPEEDDEKVLLVELIRYPRALVEPVEICADSWDEALERAARWVAVTVLPRTRSCASPPWTMWQGLRLSEELFALHETFLAQRAGGRLDDAMTTLRELIEWDPRNLAFRLEKGKLQEQRGMYLDALETYDDIVGDAARRSRELAYLRHGAPASRADGARRSADPAWNDPRHGSGYSPHDPVVYVARYRYAILLGHGDKLAAEWWAPPTNDRERTAEVHRLRTTLRERLLGRYSEQAERLQAGKAAANENRRARTDPEQPLVVSKITEFLGDPGLRRDRGDVRRRLQPDARIFFTTIAAWELEYMVAERISSGLDALRYRRQREVVPARSLELCLLWAILRRAMALAHAADLETADLAVGPRHRTDELTNAESSLLFFSPEPLVLPDVAGMLGGGWPASLDVVAKTVRSVMERRGRTVRTWLEHYSAACVYALLLLPAAGADTSSEVPVAVNRDVVRAALGELEKAVMASDGDFLTERREWLLTEDPDLDELRRTDEFARFATMTLGVPGTARGRDR